MEKYYKSLKKTDLFQKLDGDLERILSCLHAVVKHYETDEILLLAGSTVSAMGIIVRGSALVTKEDIDGNRIIIASLREGDLFGESAACAGVENSPVTVMTYTGCDAIWIDISRVFNPCQYACPHHLQLFHNLLRHISSKNLFLNSRIDVLTQKTLRDKIITFLDLERRKAGTNSFQIHFTREELADYLFANRSALSRELSLMQEEGLIQFQKNQFQLFL